MDKLTAQFTLGEYKKNERVTWAAFRKKYEQEILARKRPGTQRNAKRSFDLFEQLAKIKFVDAITTRTIDSFASRLLECPGKKRGSKMSVFTVNKQLRHLKAAIRRAYRWEYLTKPPEFDFHDEPQKRPIFMVPEHFDQIYRACEQARHPADRPYGPADWWRALMVLGIMTGMRIDEMMTLGWDDVSLDAGNLIVRHQVTKAKRDDLVPLHPVAVDHLRRLIDFGSRVFDWPFVQTALHREWCRIPQLAGIDLPCREEHEHTPRCHVYGFHALKKACGTLNAGRLPKAVLNAFMRHASQSTTERYYLDQEKLKEGVTDMMFVPRVLQNRS